MFDCFLSGDDFTFLADIVSEWLAYGIGFGAIVWVISAGLGLLWSVIRY